MDNLQFERIEYKLDQLLSEVLDLKSQLNGYCHMPRDKPLDIQQAADYLHLSTSSIYKLIYATKLTPIQRSGKTRLLFTLEELDNFLRRINNYKK